MQASSIEIEVFEGVMSLYKGKGGSLDEPLENMAKKYGDAPSAFLFRWCIQRSVIAITTLRKAKRLEENMQILEPQLEAGEMEEITDRSVTSLSYSASEEI